MALSVFFGVVDRYRWLLILAEFGIRSQRMLGVGTWLGGFSGSLVTCFSVGTLNGSNLIESRTRIGNRHSTPRSLYYRMSHREQEQTPRDSELKSRAYHTNNHRDSDNHILVVRNFMSLEEKSPTFGCCLSRGFIVISRNVSYEYLCPADDYIPLYTSEIEPYLP